MYSFQYYTTQARKFKNLLKLMLCKLWVILSSPKRSVSPNGEARATERTRNNHAQNISVQLSTQEAIVLRNKALKMRRHIQETITHLSITMSGNPNREEVGNFMHSRQGGSSVEQQIHDLGTHLENVNGAIQTLNLFIIQNGEDWLGKCNIVRNDNQRSGHH